MQTQGEQHLASAQVVEIRKFNLRIFKEFFLTDKPFQPRISHTHPQTLGQLFHSIM